MRNAYRVCSLVCLGALLALAGCGSNNDDSAAPSGSGGGGAGGKGGAGGSAAKGGSGGGGASNVAGSSNNAGAGGTGVAGQASGGSAGANSGGIGGESAGTGGAAAGSGGANGGSAGASAGTGGATGGSAGASAGTGGAAAGSGGASAGAGGAVAGAGGATGGSAGASSAGAGGAIAGSGGTAGASAGNGGSGGDLGGSGGVGGNAAGAGGNGGAAAGAGGSGGSGGACPTVPYTTLFDFADGSAINPGTDNSVDGTTNPGGALDLWTRSRYGSTANGVDDFAGAAANNLAKLTTLAFEPNDGNPGSGSLKISAGYVGTVNERLSIVYAVDFYGNVATLANVTDRLLSANVKLVSTPLTNCTFTATAWSTADTNQDGTGFQQNNGSAVTLTNGSWVVPAFDLDASADKLRVNQFGIDIRSVCTGTPPTTTDPTVIEIDHVSLACK